MTFKQMSEGDRGGRGASNVPLPDQNFFIFMQFSGKIAQIIGWRPPLGDLAPTLGNPGSATACFIQMSNLSGKWRLKVFRFSILH